jgi:hypothetical protein
MFINYFNLLCNIPSNNISLKMATICGRNLYQAVLIIMQYVYMSYGNLYATRRRRRPKMRWLDDVSTDLRKMGLNEWRDRATDREAWRLIVMEAEANPGL